MLVHFNADAIHPKRVIILGEGGFISPFLQDVLKNHHVPFLALSSKQVDLTDPSSQKALIDLITPMIPWSSYPPLRRARVTVFSFDEESPYGENVCAVLAQKDCAQLVYLSSDAVYDASKIPLDEDSSREPVSLYSLMHTAREMMLGEALHARGIPFARLRPCYIYGPGDTHNGYGPNRFLRTALQDKKIVLYGRGEEKRSYIYIKDAVELIRCVLCHRSDGELNLVVQTSVSHLEIARLVIDLFPEQIALEYAPRSVPSIHRPYKPTQVFRYLYNLGRPISPIVHRPYMNRAIFRSFPRF